MASSDSGEQLTFFGKDSPFNEWHPARFEADNVRAVRDASEVMLFVDEAMGNILKSGDREKSQI